MADRHRVDFAGPLLIVGPDRSGTTLTRLVVNASEAVQIPPESWFLIDVLRAGVPRGPIDRDEAAAIIDVVVGHQRFADWTSTEADLRRSVESDAPYADLGGLIERIFRTEVGDVVVWGDKTPEYVFWLDELTSLFPTARVVICVRDPRDAGLSLLRLGWRGRSVWEVTDYLNRTWDSTTRAEQRSAPVLRIRYEDLVADPDRERRRIGTFVGLEAPIGGDDLDVRRVAARDVPQWERDTVHADIGRPPGPGDSARWTRLTTRADRVRVRMIEARTRRILDEAGYERAHGSWLDGPLIVLTMADHLAVVSRPSRTSATRTLRRVRRRTVRRGSRVLSRIWRLLRRP